jgi:acyl carrier protein
VAEKVIGIAADVFGVPKAQINVQSSPETVEAWDSTRHLSFILALEETFGLQLSPEETEQIHNVGEAIQVVEEKVRAAGR